MTLPKREPQYVLMPTKDLKWMAQTIHQAYHTSNPGSWQECHKATCSFVTMTIAEAPVE